MQKKLLASLLPALICCTCGNGQNATRAQAEAAVQSSAPGAPGASSPSAAAAAPTSGPTVGKCPVFPADNVWNTPVDRLPIHPRSAVYMKSIGLDKPLHPDFGRDPATGLPVNVVSGSQAKVTLQMNNDESDKDPVPIPPNPALEGGEDKHLIVVDRDNCQLYEMYAAKPIAAGWTAGTAAHYDLRSNALRPAGWSSADAAGLPIFAGLVRYEEVASGEIKHAIRFTAPRTTRSFLWPARHFASRTDDSALPPMGLRVRLRADFDISGFSKETQVILRALKKYGMILSDNGGPWFITGAPNPAWDPIRMTEEMRKVMGSNFEAVDAGSLMRTPDSAAVLMPAPAVAGRGPTIGKCPVFPADNIWNTPVDSLPVDPRSPAYIRNIGIDKTLHPDFGREPNTGIPFNLVSGIRKVPLQVESEESDLVPVPIPSNPAQEGGEDKHLIVIDQDDCQLYEMYAARPAPGAGWIAGTAAHFDLRSNALRPDGWTSGDAAGTPIFPGLVRYEEVAAGEIKHAIRFTAPKTNRAYVWPARHFASRNNDAALPPMGLRVRLRASFDISGFSKETQVILRALKKYGMILSDNGGAWFITGAPNPAWDPMRMTEEMRKVAGSEFEVVDATPLMRGPNSAAAIDPAPPVMAGARGPMVGNCPVFPANDIWNTPVDTLPADARTPVYLQSIGRDKPLHPDFSLPFNIVTANVPSVPVRVDNDESDKGVAPVPANPVIEGGEDKHLILLDQGTCKLFEFYAASRGPQGWMAGTAAHYDLRSNALRPDGWTSADAAGLPIFPGLVRYDEVALGEIRHAIRFTAPKTRKAYIWPARHFASRSDDGSLPPMGLRMRLRADFDISGFSKETQVILRALKKYGMILSDNGGAWFITGAPDPHWDANRLTEEMRRVTGAAFEAVDVTPLMMGPNSGAAGK